MFGPFGSMLALVGSMLGPFGSILGTFRTLLAELCKKYIEFGIDLRRWVFQKEFGRKTKKELNPRTTKRQTHKQARRNARSRTPPPLPQEGRSVPDFFPIPELPILNLPRPERSLASPYLSGGTAHSAGPIQNPENLVLWTNISDFSDF